MDGKAQVYGMMLEYPLDFMINGPSLTEKETLSICQQVQRFNPASVTVKPCYIQAVMPLLSTNGVRIGTVIGGPAGSNTTQTKITESKRALTEGATLLVTYANIGYTREVRHEALEHDFLAISGLAHMNHAKVEAFIDPQWLTNQEILKTAQIATRAAMDVISVPLVYHDGKWDINLFSQLQDEVGDAVEVKGCVQNIHIAHLNTLPDISFARLGIHYTVTPDSRK